MVALSALPISTNIQNCYIRQFCTKTLYRIICGAINGKRLYSMEMDYIVVFSTACEECMNSELKPNMPCKMYDSYTIKFNVLSEVNDSKDLNELDR